MPIMCYECGERVAKPRNRVCSRCYWRAYKAAHPDRYGPQVGARWGRQGPVSVGVRELRRVAPEGVQGLQELPPTEPLPSRPRCRAECVDGPRPCPWVGCRHHLYLEVTLAGSLTFNHPSLEPWELSDSCALDVAERGGETLEATGSRLNLTRERVRQITEMAAARLQLQMEGHR